MCSLPFAKSTDIVDQVPTLNIAELLAESGHDRTGIAIRDPFEELAIGVHSRCGMDAQVSRWRVKGKTGRTIPFALRAVTGQAVLFV